jgi:hypothetical protein
MVEAYVTINGKSVNMDTLNTEQRKYVATAIELQRLNSRYGHLATFRCDELPDKAELFAEFGVLPETSAG